MKIGYIRVSTEEQNTDRQDVLMQELKVEKIFSEKISGKTTDGRVELKKMIDFARENDTIIVESISRIARNTKDLLEIIDTLREKKVKFVSVKEAIDTETATGKFMLTVFGAVAELEREYIRARQREGIILAKADGKYTGRKQIEVDNQKFNKLYAQWKREEIKAVEFQEKINLKPRTFYRKIQQYEESLKNQ